MKVLIQHEREGHVMKMLTREQLTTEVSFEKNSVVDNISYYQGASPYHLNYCGYEPCPSGYTFGPYMRKSFLLHFVVRGSGSLEKEDRIYKVSPGQIFAIYPGEITTYRASKDDPWKYYWIGFNGYQAEQILERMGFSRETPVVSVGDVKTLIECVENILSMTQDSLGDEIGRTGEMLRFFHTVIREKQSEMSSSRAGGAEYAEYALRYISNNFDKNIKIADLAKKIGINRSYLAKIFTNIYKMSPQSFLTKLRLDHATDLLVHTNLNVTEIGLQCGYNDIFAFSRMFSRHLGCSPLEYRKRFAPE